MARCSSIAREENESVDERLEYRRLRDAQPGLNIRDDDIAVDQNMSHQISSGSVTSVPHGTICPTTDGGINAAISVISSTYIVSREELDEVIASIREAACTARDDEGACIWITVAIKGSRQRRCLTQYP